MKGNEYITWIRTCHTKMGVIITIIIIVVVVVVIIIIIIFQKVKSR